MDDSSSLSPNAPIATLVTERGGYLPIFDKVESPESDDSEHVSLVEVIAISSDPVDEVTLGEISASQWVEAGEILMQR